METYNDQTFDVWMGYYNGPLLQVPRSKIGIGLFPFKNSDWDATESAIRIRLAICQFDKYVFLSLSIPCLERVKPTHAPMVFLVKTHSRLSYVL
jgi:hypothetical protein